MIPIKFTKYIHEQMIVDHLCSLEDEDRRLRFGGMVNDDFIKEYVNKSLDDENSQWLGCVAHTKIVSACHVAIHNGEEELGCSVDSEYRGKGLAQEMFDRAITFLRSHNVSNVFMHCLTENATMRHIAKKNRMTIVSCYGETDAKVVIEPPTPLTAMRDAYLDRMSMYDMLFRSNTEMYEAFLKSLTYGKRNNLTRTN